MASLTLKNIPDELLEKLRVLAERKRRSITQQVLYMLEQAVALGEDAEGPGPAQRAPAGSDEKLEGR